VVAVFPGLNLWEAGILAAILAPTDAGLGQIIVTSERVPMKIRQALNVEAGLNDGLSVPFLLFFVGLAGIEGTNEDAGLGRFIVEQLGLGALADRRVSAAAPLCAITCTQHISGIMTNERARIKSNEKEISHPAL
jgi:sodium/hydrogen antiporter